MATWFEYKEPAWVDKIDYADASTIMEIGISREKLKELLYCLQENGIIEG